MKNNPHPEYLAYSILLLIAVFTALSTSPIPAVERVAELLLLAAMLLILSFLLITIRLLQPDYARYPVFYSYTPLIVFPFYYYFIDTRILSEITFIALQITSLIVFAGITATYFKSLKNGYLLPLSIVFLLSALILYWNVGEGPVLILSQLFAGVGMIMICFKFPSLIQEHKR